MGDLFRVIINAFKSKILGVWTKFKLFTNINFLRAKVFVRIRKFFSGLFNIRPKDGEDYYAVGKWLVSKRLAFALTVVIGVVGIYYLFFVNASAMQRPAKAGVKAYKYHAFPLRFTDGTVQIYGKSNYLAYEGGVSKGTANGRGKLYRKDGTLVYDGNFEKSKYQGEGQMYYPSGQLRYTGGFQDNLFSGTGVLYRENGSREYEGSFLSGMKDGEGIYYDGAGNAVFTGNFSKDALLYTDFLGKSAADIKDIYTGKKTVYTDENYFVVSMPDIDGIYYGRSGSENLDGNVKIEGVYVLSENFRHSGHDYGNTYEMREIFGEFAYEGNSYITMPEAVAVHTLNEKKNTFYGDVAGTWNKTLEDVVEVEAYDAEYAFYLYAYVKDGLRYTFFGKDRTGTFSMYLIETE